MTKYEYMVKLSNTLTKLSDIPKEFGGATDKDKALLVKVDDEIYKYLMKKEQEEQAWDNIANSTPKPHKRNPKINFG